MAVRINRLAQILLMSKSSGKTFSNTHFTKHFPNLDLFCLGCFRERTTKMKYSQKCGVQQNWKTINSVHFYHFPPLPIKTYRYLLKFHFFTQKILRVNKHLLYSKNGKVLSQNMKVENLFCYEFDPDLKK